MFSNLSGMEGMIRYIGWFSNYESGPDGRQEYFNIVLELADSDFYDTILDEAPPISFQEINGFWRSMSEVSRTLASLHTVEIDRHEYSVWHGDIKPENILRVNDQFKLADPGEASMLLKQCGLSTLPRSQATRGTRTYASPEKAAHLNGLVDSESAITQRSDVWSFGCVLSIAATFVVLGAQGFLIYKELRLLAKDDMNDAFHDGENVLGHVISWHKYLREAARRTDPFTSAVLDMVDFHMLVPSTERWEATRVHEEFKRILDNAQAVESLVATDLLSLIETIDLEAEHHQDQSFGFTRVDSDTLRRPRPNSLLSSDTTGEGRKKLSKKSIQPTAQRSRKTDGSPVQTPRPSLRMPVINHHVESRESFPYQTPNMERFDVFAANGQSSASYHSTGTGRPTPPGPPQNLLGTPEVLGMKVAQVKQMLQKNGMLYKPNPRSLSSLLGKQQATVKGIVSNNELLVLLDQRLEEEFKNRDIATELLEVLVWRALGYDEDGMELYFTNPDTKPGAIVDSAKARSFRKSVKKYTKAMELAEPLAPGSTACKTTIIPQLERIINDYSMVKASRKIEERKKTIIVLTDGRWEGMHDEYSADIYLESAFHGLKDLHSDGPPIEGSHLQTGQDIAKIRPVTIEFVQFDNDQRATERLRRLDDDLKLHGCP
ncbi:hypothetical protein CBS470a_001784 [Colletotrichum nupharicola]|nr:hypothetical protein CBS470a_001784 [Colletotrichum nupharicola]